jgi:hypothetical protein
LRRLFLAAIYITAVGSLALSSACTEGDDSEDIRASLVRIEQRLDELESPPQDGDSGPDAPLLIVTGWFSERDFDSDFELSPWSYYATVYCLDFAVEGSHERVCHNAYVNLYDGNPLHPSLSRSSALRNLSELIDPASAERELTTYWESNAREYLATVRCWTRATIGEELPSCWRSQGIDVSGVELRE